MLKYVTLYISHSSQNFLTVNSFVFIYAEMTFVFNEFSIV